MVDEGLGVTMYSAPFYCSKKHLFDAVFGNVQDDFHDWSEKLDLTSDKVVKALDRCREPIKTPDPSAPAPAAAHALPGGTEPVIAPTESPVPTPTAAPSDDNDA